MGGRRGSWKSQRSTWLASTLFETGGRVHVRISESTQGAEAGIGQRELALMGLGTPFDARKPHHVQALKRYAASKQDVRTSVRVDL